ncbi:hypothetical protein BPAE_0416g00040 [Botrytis paeoniae]|uniref:Uncharacterized protein n=1 Tax=Botrytis paeoniae TaxID=278948 RepID=A0A4Z1F8P4_9HELO|nr:hypothetical protein BPAE_0416g00040 [Botrytis paeoniae]
MTEEADDLPSSQGLSGGMESKQKEDMPEKPTQKGNVNDRLFWLDDEIDTLCEIMEGHIRESHIERRSKQINWILVTEEFNRRFEGRLQEKGALRKDGESQLTKGRYAPKRGFESVRKICQRNSRLKSMLAEYKNPKEETDSEIDEESNQVEVYEGDQSPPQMFKWKGIRYIDNNDRVEAELHKPDKRKTIIEYISLLSEPRQDNPEHFKLGLVLFEYKATMRWESQDDVIALNQWRQMMLHRTSGVPLERKEMGLSFNCAWSWGEKYKLGNIIIKRVDETRLRNKDYSEVDFSSVTKDFNDNLGVYRTKNQIKRFVDGKDVTKFIDDYIKEQDKRKRKMKDANATAEFALSAKNSRIFSFEDGL